MNITTHSFSLTSSTQVAQTIEDINQISQGYMLVHIASYMLNTVMIHNLISELKQNFNNPKTVKLPHIKGEPTKVTVFTYDESTHLELKEKELRIEDVVLHKLSMESQETLKNLHSSKQEVVKRYFTDALTGLNNIYQLRQDLENSTQHTLIFISFDNFKMINDFYGFIVGDFLLEKIALTLKSKITDESVRLYRITGSEFALLLDKHLDFYTLKEYLSTLYESLRHLNYDYHNTKIYLDVSIGSISNANNADIFSKVSMALQHAKENSLPFWIYEERMNFEKRYESNLKASLSIRKAILNADIIPYFQPIQDNKSGKIIQYECLSRLRDEQGTIISPENFIPIAKRIKVYEEVTKNIIDKSFEVFKDSPYDFSINLSMDDIYSATIYEFILDKLKQSQQGTRVIFELIETKTDDDFDKLARFIKEVKRFGARIAIDDFGAGYSNFTVLTKIEPNILKIDSELIKNIDTNNSARIIVESIVAFCKKLDIKTTAEYVHSSTILTVVKELGIDYSQGFLIDMPSPHDPHPHASGSFGSSA